MRIIRILVTLCAFSLTGTGQAVEIGIYGQGAPASFSYDNGRNLSTNFHQRYLNSRHAALGKYNGSTITSFSIHRAFGESVFHYGTTYADSEHQQYTGVSLGRATIAYFQGQGRSFSKTGSVLYEDLNHYFFHGGNQRTFGFRGAGVDVDVSPRLSTQFAGVRINAPGVEDRYGYYLGATAGRFKGGVFGLERGSEFVGHGFSFSVTGSRFATRYQEIRNEYGAYMRRVSFSLRQNQGSSWALNFEDMHNPLYSSGDEQRVMFTYQRSLGPRVAFGVSGEPSSDSEGEVERKKKQEKFGTVIGIGAAVGAVALVASSGSDSTDSQQRFSTQNEAAFDVLNNINPESVRLNREHGGWIYRYLDGTFSYTQPVLGEVASVNIGDPSSVPGGSTASASYHTHGGPDPRYDNENFSPTDIFSDIVAGVDGYLGTPAGFMKYHNVSAGTITTLGTINN